MHEFLKLSTDAETAYQFAVHTVTPFTLDTLLTPDLSSSVLS